MIPMRAAECRSVYRAVNESRQDRPYHRCGFHPAAIEHSCRFFAALNSGDLTMVNNSPPICLRRPSVLVEHLRVHCGSLLLSRNARRGERTTSACSASSARDHDSAARPPISQSSGSAKTSSLLYFYCGGGGSSPWVDLTLRAASYRKTVRLYLSERKTTPAALVSVKDRIRNVGGPNPRR